MKGLRSFQSKYDIPAVCDYTFLGTERSVEKPIVRFDGRIDIWFDPVDYVSWVKKSIEAGCFDLELVDGYLPAVKYTYQNPESNETCEMTAFAVDRDSLGAIHLYVRLVEKVNGREVLTHHFRLRDQAVIDQTCFETELQKIRDHWTLFFKQGTLKNSVESILLDACKASIIRALITFTGKHPHYGVRNYGAPPHDGFPPTIISLVDCLASWGHVSLSLDYLLYYFERFVTETGHFDYYGPSLAEYGQMLSLVRRLVDITDNHEWLNVIRPKLERIYDGLWSKQSNSRSGLIAGVPEADTRNQIDIYFHNNAWCWRGLKDIMSVLGRLDMEERCDVFREAIINMIEEVADKESEPVFYPPVARKMKPFKTMTQDALASYTNYRYWPELLSSGILSREQMNAITKYRIVHGGEVNGMTHFANQADNWPIAEYGMALLEMGKTDEFYRLLFSHLAGHQTRQTWTAYEQVSLEGKPCRKAVADYCVPVQLVAPRLLAKAYHY
jgi:hypothetical protein